MLPIKGKCYITQGYGLTDFAKTTTGKSFYKNFPGGIHPGIDFGTGGINLPILSLVMGKVVRASMDGGWGNHLEIEELDGWRRQYSHLQSISVKVGDKVTIGQVLGLVGTTGSSTAIHLHYGNRKWNLLSLRWEYRDPSRDFDDPPKVILPTKKLIKSNGDSAVYIYNEKMKFLLPDWETKVFLFGEGDKDIESIQNDILSKIPMGTVIPSLK